MNFSPSIYYRKYSPLSTYPCCHLILQIPDDEGVERNQRLVKAFANHDGERCLPDFFSCGKDTKNAASPNYFVFIARYIM